MASKSKSRAKTKTTKAAKKPSKVVKLKTVKRRKGQVCKLTVDQIGAMTARPEGASMDELVKAAGIDSHQMRAKIYAAKNTLGYKIVRKEGRYHGTAPKARKPAKAAA